MGKTYRDGGFQANVDYEVGQPAYPDPTHDKSHQLPLTQDKLTSILTKTQPQHPGGFSWEMYKGDAGEATATQVAQQLCKAVLGDAPRCSGVIPPPGSAPPAPTPSPTPTPTPTPTPSPTPSGDKFMCVNDQCVASDSGVSQEVCSSICGEAPSKYKCENNQCVASSSGADKDTCEALCGSFVL